MRTRASAFAFVPAFALQPRSLPVEIVRQRAGATRATRGGAGAVDAVAEGRFSDGALGHVVREP